MANVFIDQDSCSKCGRCVEICPTDVLRTDLQTGYAIVAYPDDCSGCFFCSQECPTECISIDDRRETDSVSIYEKLGIVDTWKV
jgi:NAD-dependent dihydropyrimidine dehydrogenase PreA subunit